MTPVSWRLRSPSSHRLKTHSPSPESSSEASPLKMDQTYKGLKHPKRGERSLLLDLGPPPLRRGQNLPRVPYRERFQPMIVTWSTGTFPLRRSILRHRYQRRLASTPYPIPYLLHRCSCLQRWALQSSVPLAREEVVGLLRGSRALPASSAREEVGPSRRSWGKKTRPPGRIIDKPIASFVPRARCPAEPRPYYKTP